MRLLKKLEDKQKIMNEAIDKLRKHTPENIINIVLKEEEIPEFIGQIIDSFEALLDDKGIVLPNIERDQDDGLDPEEAANIFGEDYYRLEDEIKEIIKRYSNKED